MASFSDLAFLGLSGQSYNMTFQVLSNINITLFILVCTYNSSMAC